MPKNICIVITNVNVSTMHEFVWLIVGIIIIVLLIM